MGNFFAMKFCQNLLKNNHEFLCNAKTQRQFLKVLDTQKLVICAWLKHMTDFILCLWGGGGILLIF